MTANLPAEEWRWVVGREGDYEVSNLGRVRSWLYRGTPTYPRRPEPVVLTPLHAGARREYRKVTFYGKGRPSQRYVHVLVAEAFLPPRPTPKHEVAHDDGNGSHNVVTNLEWKTRKENFADKHRHGTAQQGERANGARLTNAMVREIRAEPANTSSLALSKRYPVSSSTIRRVRRRETWSHIQ